MKENALKDTGALRTAANNTFFSRYIQASIMLFLFSELFHWVTEKKHIKGDKCWT